MNSVAALILLGVAVVTALPAYDPNRIVGGSETTIEQYPYAVVVMSSSSGNSFWQSCGGTILNNRAVLTAAHCFRRDNQPFQFRLRVGSTRAHSGGHVFNTQQIFSHPNYVDATLDMDFAVMHVVGTFMYSDSVAQARIASRDYHIADDQHVWAIGWGSTCWGWCQSSEVLRHVQIYTINQKICADRYATRGNVVTNNMMCSGVLDVGGRDQCQGDSGGPLIYNGVVVGVCSWGYDCATARFPGVNARVSAATDWIVSVA